MTPSPFGSLESNAKELPGMYGTSVGVQRDPTARTRGRQPEQPPFGLSHSVTSRWLERSCRFPLGEDARSVLVAWDVRVQAGQQRGLPQGTKKACRKGVMDAMQLIAPAPGALGRVVPGFRSALHCVEFWPQAPPASFR